MPLHSVIAVIGAGTMGLGVAQVAATAGHRVVLIDMNADALERARTAITTSLDSLVSKGRLDPAAREAIQSRIQWSSSIAAAAGCALAIEVVVENVEVKREVFSALEAIVSSDAILASNTSSLSIGDIATSLQSPRRFLGLHFFNPVPLMNLVEVVPGTATDPTVVTAAMALMRAWGKTPVAVADVPGFIVNRVARPYYGEAFAALAAGIAPAVIDLALTQCGGFRMGPLALSDMIGQDVNYTVASTLFEAYGGVTRFRLQPAQKALVDTGALGRKSGAGVYDYSVPVPKPAVAPTAPRPAAVAVGNGDMVLEQLCRDAGFAPGGSPGGLMIVDGVTIACTDGRPLAARPDVSVLIDAVRDLGRARAVVLTARTAQAGAIAAGLIQAGGRDALFIPDRPGMIVLRILAQLANAAADAVSDGVAEPDGIDAALVHGAGHPEGPLAWARRTGYRTVATNLHNIAVGVGEPMYEPCPYLAQGDDIS
jgi:3-hydroxybutyryl-CoA dehydrogenase